MNHWRVGEDFAFISTGGLEHVGEDGRLSYEKTTVHFKCSLLRHEHDVSIFKPEMFMSLQRGRRVEGIRQIVTPKGSRVSAGTWRAAVRWTQTLRSYVIGSGRHRAESGSGGREQDAISATRRDPRRKLPLLR